MPVRAVCPGPDDRVLAGRSLNRKLPIVSNMWSFPGGMEWPSLAWPGLAGERSVEWTSQFGSLAVSGYRISTADGMNGAG